MRISNTILIIVTVLIKMSTSISIRSATNTDLYRIQYLIRESFLAMLPHTHESMRSQVEGNAEKAIQDELIEEKFSQVYFSKPENHFWVAVDSNDLGTYSFTHALSLLLNFSLSHFSHRMRSTEKDNF